AAAPKLRICARTKVLTHTSFASIGPAALRRCCDQARKTTKPITLNSNPEPYAYRADRDHTASVPSRTLTASVLPTPQYGLSGSTHAARSVRATTNAPHR